MDSSQDLGSSGGGVHEALAAGEVRLSPGHRVGRYTVRRLIGVGGMGCVYEADDVELSRVVALKVLRHQGRAADHNSARLRLLREGQAMARLSHPNVVPVYGVDSVDGMVFIAMEYVAGETLRSWLRDTSRTWQEILDVVLQAGAGLAAAHAEGIIHRDFKPGNVLVGADGRARVMDFGLARGQDSPSGMVTPVGMHATADFLASQPITKAGAVVGTPAYMAPEQHFGRTADGKSDQFAFSVTLYEALFRRRPFPEDRGFRGLARAKDRGEIIRPPRSAGVPRWLGAAVMRGLAARKVDRFASMTAMLSFLRRRRRRRLPLVLGGAGALLVAGGVGATVLLQDDPCDAGLERVDALWSTAERDRVFAALRAGEGSHAAETFDRVTAQLDGWAARWRTAYTDACRGPQSAAVEETVACLGRSRAALAAAVQTLSQPGPGLVDAAVAVASSLPSADRCQRPTGPEIAAPAEEIRAEVDAIASTLAEAEVLEVAGRFADGLALAEDAVSAAEAVGYEPVLARALRLQGNLLERGGKREAAAAVLERAYVTAVSAGDDRTAARAAARLVNVHADALFAPEVAQRWLDELRSRVARLSSAPEAQVWLHQAEGTVGMARSDYTRAADAFARGLAEFDAMAHPSEVRRGTLLHNLGIAYYKAGRLELAQETLQAAITAQERALGALHPSVATTLGALAGVHYAGGDNDAAMLVAQRGLSLQRRTLGPRHPDVAASLCNMAGLLIAMERREEAKAALTEAREIWEAVDETTEMSAFAIGNLGNLLLSVGDSEEAEPVARRALRMKVELFGEMHEEVGTARTLLGDVLVARGQTDGARQEFEQVLRTFEQTLGPHHPQMAPVLMRLASVLESHDRAAAQAAYGKAATVAEHNRRWEEAGNAHFALARLLGAGQSRAARKRAKAALAAYQRAQGDQSAHRDKVQAWLADLG